MARSLDRSESFAPAPVLFRCFAEQLNSTVGSAESFPGDYTAFAVMPTSPDDYPTVLYLVSKKREKVVIASRKTER